MEIRFQNLGPDKWQAGIILAFGCEGENLLTENPVLDKICPWIAVAPALRDFKAKKHELCLLHGHPDLKIPRALGIGLGKRSKLDPGIIREAVALAVQKCHSLGVESILLPEPFLARLPGGRSRLLEECVCAAILALYQFNDLKTNTKDLTKDPAWLAIGFDQDSPADAAESARLGENDAEAVTMARNLDNMPGNMLYPETLARKAVSLAAEGGFSCTVLNEEALEEAGMGCLLAVGGGSSHPPRLIVLEYAPEGHEQEKPLVLIGKGITFDSGGLCLKPASNMNQMKCDMSGAAAVLAAIRMAAKEKTPRRICGLLACAENMPDGRAYRPGDVLRCASGETVEVVNTDAEGRLALCDALSYARKSWTPAAIIDIATLTGACAVALGSGLAGLFCDDADFSGRIMAFGAAAGENFWHMPLWEPYAENLKSRVADIRHTGPREGGAITAALFLKHFVQPGELWAHLDIAGVDWVDKSTPLCPEGPSGFGARTLLALARGGIA